MIRKGKRNHELPLEVTKMVTGGHLGLLKAVVKHNVYYFKV
jgi:hypothetical protein